MGKTITLLGIALIAICVLWLWLSLRKYAARKQLEEKRATAFMAEAIRAAEKRDDTVGTS
jgi:hypothetical protein